MTVPNLVRRLGCGMAVDAYAAQHPGTTDRRADHSVAAHLISLHFAHSVAVKNTLSQQEDFIL